MKPLLVAGIGTHVGKTLVSAILVEMLSANYFKPLSTGDSDKDYIAKLLALESHRVHSEFYSFKTAASPHYSAWLEDEKIVQKPFEIKSFKVPLIIESAGGVLVPINQSETTLDWFQGWPVNWILVSRHYLGSINHTLSSFEVLKEKGVEISGIIFNGNKMPHHESFILDYTKLPLLGRIQEEKKIDFETIKRYARQWKQHSFWKNLLSKYKKM